MCWVSEDHRHRYICSSCQIVHYQNPRVIVTCIVEWSGRILMCKRAREPYSGKWCVPSGFLEQGETLEEGAARETYEETGVRLEPDALDLYSVISMPSIDQIAISLRTHLLEAPTLACGSESTEVALVSMTEHPVDDFAWVDATGDRRESFSAELRKRQFGISLMSLGINQQSGRIREYQVSSVTAGTLLRKK